MKQCQIVLEDNMPWYSATGRCVVSSMIPDWGRFGQIQSIGNIEAPSKAAALTRAKSVFPGGWEILAITEQDHCHDGACGCFKLDEGDTF